MRIELGEVVMIRDHKGPTQHYAYAIAVVTSVTETMVMLNVDNEYHFDPLDLDVIADNLTGLFNRMERAEGQVKKLKEGAAYHQVVHSHSTDKMMEVLISTRDKMEVLEQENKMLMTFASQQPHFKPWCLKYRNEKKL